MIANPVPESTRSCGTTIEFFDFRPAEGADPGPADRLPDQAIWIAWERQRRTLGLAQSFRIRLYRLIYDGYSPLRYPVLAFHTFRLIWKNRPGILVVQNPSLLLTAFAVFLKIFFSYALVVDRHTNFMINREKSLVKTLFTALSDFTLKHSDLTIITNNPLAELVAGKGGKPFILPDPIPRLEPSDSYELPAGRNICFICTFAKDEPYEEVIAASADLPPGVSILITGNPSRAGFSAEARGILSENPQVILTGFLSDGDYSGLLHSADAIMDLTTLDHCLVCGAYEGIAAQKPLILSDKQANHELFGDLPEYVGPTRGEILGAITNTLSDLDARKEATGKFRTTFEKDWQDSFSRLVAMLVSLSR